MISNITVFSDGVAPRLRKVTREMLLPAINTERERGMFNIFAGHVMLVQGYLRFHYIIAKLSNRTP